MKKLNRIIIFVVVISLLISSSVFAIKDSKTDINSSNKKSIINYVCEQVKDSYSEYYTIPNISGQVNKIKKTKDGIYADVSVSFTKILLAESSSDLPYIQGLEEEASKLSNAEEKAVADKHIAALKKDLDTNYIGVEQTENSNFSIFIPASTSLLAAALPNAELQFCDEFGELMDMGKYAPQSKNELIQSGKKALSSILTADSEKVQKDISIRSNPSSPTDYNRIAARNYARTYTCNLGGQNPSYYNSAYSYYSADCANYVSQCIYAGGISTDSVWKPYTIAWINTGYSSSYYGLTEYMVDEGFFFYSSNKYDAFAGSIISWTSYSHVGMVDQNDTVTMTYCAHTNDRLSSSFKSLTGVVFYVPEWDSYAGDWTR